MLQTVETKKPLNDQRESELEQQAFVNQEEELLEQERIQNQVRKIRAMQDKQTTKLNHFSQTQAVLNQRTFNSIEDLHLHQNF